MMRQRKRIVSAWLLLSVFVSMILLSGLHRHQPVINPAADCVECAHHVHHSGHFTIGADHVHECVLCQLLSLPYLPSTGITVTLFFSLAVVVTSRGTSPVCRLACTTKSPRAPPFIL